MTKKRCLFCPRRVEPYAPQARRQRVCKEEECRYKLKLALNRAWRRKRNAQWRQEVNRQVRVWAQTYPRYWRAYRKSHPRYVARDNARRARALRRQRWGCSAKDEL